MNANKILISLSLMFLLGFNCHAYEVGTHALLTEAAYEDSVLSDNSRNLLLEIGMIKSADDPTPEFPNEIVIVRNSTGTMEIINELMEPKELLRFGAKHEDDLSLSLRVLNHFYDPQHRGSPLTVSGFFRLGQPSPDWALEDRSALPMQFYSYNHALEYFSTSLTAETSENRNKNAGKLFQSLGQIVHHIQDMAQPQHTRNDPHSPFNSSARKYYESYTKHKAGNLPFAGYGAVDISVFNTPRAFWDSGDGKGLAEFSSNNFVSAGTNFKGSLDNIISSTHPNPAGSSATTEDWDITHPELLGPVGPGQPLLGDITFVGTDVMDSYRVETSMPNPRTSSYSLFDYDLKQYNFDKSFTLNRFNFDTAHSILLPRAVAYSTGLINYFFRGRFELVEQQSDGQTLTIRIKNISGGQQGVGNPLYDLNGGYFQVFYETSSRERHPLTISSPQLGGGSLIGTLASGAEIEIAAELPPEDVELAAKNPFIVIYDGSVGTGEAVIGLALPRQIGHGFVLTIPNGPNAGEALLTQKSGQWAIEPVVNPAFGNIDWKGQYVNGVSTKMLTYGGPRSRFFGSTGYTSAIYQNGILHSNAPAPVYGAAIQKDGEGREWIVAVTNDGVADSVYTRPNTPNPLSGMYHPELRPDGWREIALFPMDIGTSVKSPWFFNGEGSEAQTIRFLEIDVVRSGQVRRVIVLDRYKVTLNGTNNASMQNLENIRGESTVIAVDYKDDQELLLYLSRENWLLINDEPLISNEKIQAQCLDIHGPEPYCSTSGTLASFSAFSENFNGLLTADYHQSGIGNSSAHVYYIDLRTATALYSNAHWIMTNGRGRISGGYNINHAGASADGGTFANIMGGNPHPVYGPSGYFPLEFLGYFELKSNYFLNAFAPQVLNGGWAVGPFGNVLVSEIYADGSVFNYFSGGNLENIINAILTNSSVVPVGLQ